DAWSDRVVSLHNTYRAQYGADPLHWDGNLYSGALAWAQKCVFSHSGGSYGENLYAAAPGTGDTLAEGLSSWMSEAGERHFLYNDPVFSTNTGHFTQVVWKSTTGVACAVANCASGTIFGQSSQFLVCRYSPPGNYAGEFA
ncbi:PR-1-like protein, partial [Agrocybe pediades]